MALKIRLRKQGRTNRPFYRLVVANSLSPRDGQYIEALGWYNPAEKDAEKNLLVKADRVTHWFSQGAQLTEKAEALVAKGAPEAMKEIKGMMLDRKAKKLAKKKAAKAKQK